MTDYTIYNKDSGEILRNISISSEINEQLQAEELAIEGHYSPELHIITNNMVEDKPPYVPTLEEKKQKALTELNYSTSVKILKTVPLWQQSNLMLRMIELLYIGEPAWTKDEAKEFKDAQTTLDKIKTIRDLSDTFSGQIADPTATDKQIEAALKAYNAGLEKL
jgi:hypothetical protein